MVSNEAIIKKACKANAKWQVTGLSNLDQMLNQARADERSQISMKLKKWREEERVAYINKHFDNYSTAVITKKSIEGFFDSLFDKLNIGR